MKHFIRHVDNVGLEKKSDELFYIFYINAGLEKKSNELFTFWQLKCLIQSTVTDIRKSVLSLWEKEEKVRERGKQNKTKNIKDLI